MRSTSMGGGGVFGALATNFFFDSFRRLVRPGDSLILLSVWLGGGRGESAGWRAARRGAVLRL